MELLPLLRWSWRRRFVLLAALVVSIAAFVGLGGTRPSEATTAVAWTQVTLETPRSELAAAAPTGTDTLSWRAGLLVHLMATDASIRSLAHSLGVSQDEVSVVDPSLEAPAVQTSMAMASAQAALVVSPYTVEAFLADPTLPAISIEAGAPQPSAAERLAASAVAVLKSQASPGGSFSSAIPTDADPLSRTLQPFTIDQVAPVQVKVFGAPASRSKPIAGMLFVFLLLSFIGCRVTRRLSLRRRPVVA